VCADRDELREWLSFGNWSSGSAFAIEGTPEADGRAITLCFVQQGECTDEWLVIESWPREGGTGRPFRRFVFAAACRPPLRFLRPPGRPSGASPPRR